MLAAAMAAGALLSSCTDDMPQPVTPADRYAEAAASRSLDAGQDQTAWRDIRDFDPSLPGQTVEVELPVSCGGAETSVTARLSIMPMHVYEENGPDRLGDYYVVEADFTAHNGPMWEKGMFMKSLDVKVTPTDKQGKPIAGIAFHDNPTPATTLANRTYSASKEVKVHGGVMAGYARGSYPKGAFAIMRPVFPDGLTHTSYEMHLDGKTHLIDGDIQYMIYRQDKGDVNTTVRNLRPENFKYIQLSDGRKIFTLDGDFSGCTEGRPGNLDYYRNRYFDITNDERFVGNETQTSERFIADAVESKQGLTRWVELSIRDGSTSATSIEVEGMRIEGDKIIYHDAEGAEVTEPMIDGTKTQLPKGLLISAGASAGCSWGWSQSIHLEDVTTSLRTATDCTVEYLYTVENYDSYRGIPELARSDFHGHAVWAWRMPVAESGLTPEQLVSSLYDMHIEVAPVYATAKDTKQYINPDGDNLSYTAALEPPMRGSATTLGFSNQSHVPVCNIRLLSVPYAEWEAAGRPDNDVVAEYDGTLGRGQSCTLAAPDMDCWVVCEELDPRTLRSGRIRQSLPLHVRMDACNPRPLEVSTLDTSAVQ